MLVYQSVPAGFSGLLGVNTVRQFQLVYIAVGFRDFRKWEVMDGKNGPLVDSRRKISEFKLCVDLPGKL